MLRRLVSPATLFLLAAFAGMDARPQATEPAVKAAFLYKFAGYVEWAAHAPSQPNAPVVIAVAGADDVATELERLVPGRNINGRPVIVRRAREESLRGVHVLFVGRSDPAARTLVAAGRREGALVVTEVEKGLELGSAINFVPLDERIGFDVSLENAEAAGVDISARMLSVARRVVPKP
jgi:hypothetical protein